MNAHGFVIFVALVWLVAMLRLLPRAWRLDHVAPSGAARRKPRELPHFQVHPLVLQPLVSLCL